MNIYSNGIRVGSLQVLVENEVAIEYVQDSDFFVEAKIGSPFSIKFTNGTCGRLLIVMSVDGLSVMDGEPASYDSGGYVIKPYGGLIVPGWRVSNESVAQFKFESPEESYVAKRGADTSNIGVIGIAVFRESVPYHPPISMWDAGKREKCIPHVRGMSLNSGGMLLNSSGSAGTGWGKEQEHNVRTVEFEKMSERPAAVATMRYETAERLKELGVKVIPSEDYQKNRAFPAQKKFTFCPPPPGEK